MSAEDSQQSLTLMVGGLKATIESFQSNWQEQDRRAANSRKFLFERMENVAHTVQDLTHQVGSVVKEVAEMKPAVTDWVNSKNQAMGAKTAASILGKGFYLGVGGVLALAGWAL